MRSEFQIANKWTWSRQTVHKLATPLQWCFILCVNKQWKTHIHICTQIPEIQFHGRFGNEVSKFCWGWLCMSESACRWACVYPWGPGCAVTLLRPEPVLVTPTVGLAVSWAKINLIMIGLDPGAFIEFPLWDLCWLLAGVSSKALEFLIWVELWRWNEVGHRGSVALSRAGAFWEGSPFL